MRPRARWEGAPEEMAIFRMRALLLQRWMTRRQLMNALSLSDSYTSKTLRTLAKTCVIFARTERHRCYQPKAYRIFPQVFGVRAVPRRVK
jgi:hypothetical protein